MRTSRLIALMVGAALLAAACGSTPATVVPSVATAAPSPTPTPDPQLHDPASVDVVLSALQQAGLALTPNSADARTGNVIERLHLTYAGWPLTLSQYSSSRTLASESGFNPKVKPAVGQPPFILAGLNVLIVYGSNTQNGSPAVPDPQFVSAFQRLVDVVAPLIGPLRQQSVTPVALPTPMPTASPTPGPSASTPAGPSSPPRPSPTKH
ncbi:MAG: hypothetical protein ACRDGQ_11560 [Candidatus Limnocylindrales bacterium]